MKIKKYMALVFMCLPLCGCSEEGITKYTEQEDYEGWTADNEAAETVLAYNDLFLTEPKSEKLGKEALECLEKDFTRVEGIKHIQHSNGREVKLYESKKIRGCYVLYDGKWIQCLAPVFAFPADCKELIDALSDNALTPMESPVAGNGVSIIRCENREYTLADFDCETMFSIQYPDVTAQTEVCPIRALIFCREGKPFRVEINTPRAEGLEKPDQTSKKQVRELLDTLGFGDKSEEIAGEYIESLDKKDYLRRDGTISVRSVKNAARQRDVAYNVFSIDFG